MSIDPERLKFILVALLIPLLLVLGVMYWFLICPGRCLERRRERLSSLIDQSPIPPPPEWPEAAEPEASPHHSDLTP